MSFALDADGIVAEITAGILEPDPDARSSFNLVVPPGFGEAYLSEVLTRTLAARAPELAVATIAMDEVSDAAAFVHRLADGLRLPRPDGPPDLALPRLLEAKPPAVYILRNFHKTLDHLPTWLIGGLRNAEYLKRAHAVVLAAVSHVELKRRWAARHMLTISDYGEKHVTRMIRLRNPSDLVDILRTRGVPVHVADRLLELTGGYPDALEAALGAWRHAGRPTHLDAAARARLTTAALRPLARFVRWLDVAGHTHFRDCAVDLHHGHEAAHALDGLARHEWRDLLLADRRLRAEAVGFAAAHAAIHDAAGRQRGLLHPHTWVLYAQGAYACARELAPEEPGEPVARVLRNHAIIMEQLASLEPEGEGEWSPLCVALTEAQRWLANHGARLAGAELLARHYDGLLRVFQALASVEAGAAVDRLSRVVDGVDAPLAVLFLLTARLRAAARRPGHADALHTARSLPAQILRVWARWAVAVDDQRASLTSPELCLEIEAAWSLTNDEPLVSPGPDTAFPSLACLGVHATTRWARASPRPPALEPGWRELHAALQLVQDVGDATRSFAGGMRELREQFFALTERWLAALVATAPVEPVTIRSSLERLIQPLPLLDADGRFEWAPRADSAPVDFPSSTSQPRTIAMTPEQPFDIAILCALQEEFEKFRKASKARWEMLPVTQDDPASYEHATYKTRMGTPLRVVAGVPTQMGMPSSAVLATKMILRFKPRLVVMVGIAAGARSDLQACGNVLVPNKTFDYNAGKITTTADGGLHFTPDYDPIPLSPRLLSRLGYWADQRLELDDISREWQIPQQQTRIQIHIGPLGSGAGVIDAKKPLLDVLEHWRKLIGVEMEAYGVHLACKDARQPSPEFLCMKAISDFAAAKNDTRRDYAAYVAAQLCHRFLIFEWENLFP